MENEKKSVLIISGTFPPDMGGVETHLSDLMQAVKDEREVFVCTHKPIVTDVDSYKPFEKDGKAEIRRFWWFGGNLFRKLEPFPILLFLYMTPYLLIRTFFFMLFNSKKVDVIHAHGLNAVFITAVLKKIFAKKAVAQTHALYSFSPKSFFAKIAASALNVMDTILTLCEASKEELKSIGVKEGKIVRYTYWVDLSRFSDMDKDKAKEKAGFENKFSVFFVGRLIEIKGAEIVVELAKRFKDINFVIAGDGPDKSSAIEADKTLQNFSFLGRIDNSKLNTYYSAADLCIVPSQYPEGFGRVICESLACGTPVLASNLGGIPDAIDESVGILSQPDIESFAKNLKLLMQDMDRYESMRKSASEYAKRKFSINNYKAITGAYDLL